MATEECAGTAGTAQARQSFRFGIKLRKERSGQYTVTCPSLPGLVTYGDDRDKARANAREALTGFLRSMQKHDDLIPENDLKRRGLEIIGIFMSAR
ncbi:MAG: type II toxin-antitoxin system HicB family antitoxin [Reyranellaceae bacterium]